MSEDFMLTEVIAVALGIVLGEFLLFIIETSFDAVIRTHKRRERARAKKKRKPTT